MFEARIETWLTLRLSDSLQTIQLSESFVYAQLNDHAVLFQTIQFSRSQQNQMVQSIVMYH